MKIQTKDLTGVALDWVVAKAGNASAYLGYRDGVGKGVFLNTGDCAQYQPSTNWAQGGPIIEREAIETEPSRMNKVNGLGAVTGWRAYHPKNYGGLIRYSGHGTTLLEAAMRCYVASKLGDEVEVPDEITD